MVLMSFLLKVRKVLGLLTDALLYGRNRGYWQELPTVQPLVGLPPKGINRTRLAWIIVIVALLVYEAYTLINGVPGDTLSEAVWGVSHDYPLLPFLAGIVAGHFFWQRKTPCP